MFHPLDIWTSEEGEVRGLSRKPSKEMTVISNLVPRLYDESRGYLCSMTSVNFIGSIIAKYLEPEIKSMYAQERAKRPLSLKQSLEYVDKPIQVRQHYYVQPLSGDYQSRYKNISNLIDAESRSNVLVKRACGERAGLILRGPLAGLIFSVHVSPRRRIYCINRIWNDRILSEYTPYEFEYHRGEKRTSVDDAVQEKLNAAYYKLAYKESTATASGALFYLLRQLNIQVDEDQFHMSRFIPRRLS
jgi:hypothetical protein